MKFEVITLFPEFFNSVLEQSILKKARTKGLVQVNIHDLRPFGIGNHQVCDDEPYGGGAGMLMRVEPLVAALQSIKRTKNSQVVLLSPQGRRLSQAKLQELKKVDQLILVCGRYEGVDERFRENYIDQEISIGDYILNGGETASLVLIEGVSRLVDGVLGNAESLMGESFDGETLQHPQYTRPPDFAGQRVPDILLSGDHKAIQSWRRKKAQEKTKKRRPDLLKSLNYE